MRRVWMRLALVGVIVGSVLIPSAATAATGAIVATDSVNIRACPALDCEVIGAAELGDDIEVTGSLVNWFYPVTWFGRAGYAHALYVMAGATAPWFVEGDVSCNRIAFAFNIGIGNTPSQTVLDTLIQQDVDATMFPMGWWAEEEPAYLRALDDAGFVIGTHGHDPLFLTGQSDAVIRQDVTESIAAIESVIGRPIDPYFTPYAADTDNRVRTVVSELGLLPVGWNIAANDYAATATESAVYSRVMNGVYPGAVVEFHLDGPATAQSTARALPRIVRDLRARGYEFVTIPDMAIPCTSNYPPVPAKIATVTNTGAANLRCRTIPGTWGGVIASLAPNARAEVRGATFGGWVPLLCGGRNGWASGDYLSISGGSPPPPPDTATFATVTNTGSANLRCRGMPSTSSATIALLAAGSRVEMRGAAINGWTPVLCAGQNGWASSAYLTVQSSPPPTGATFGTVTTGGATLRCRTGPGTSNAIVTSLPAGARVEVRGAMSGGWIPVICSGKNGWVSGDFFTIEGA